MVFVKTGPYKMGSSDYEVDEGPVHLVHVDDFWIDKFPVTNQQFAEFLNEAKLTNPEKLINLRSSDVKIFMEDSIFVAESGFENHPVIEVSWHSAKDYAEFYEKSLPTEAEWEKVARGSDERMYPWGNEIEGFIANYWDSGDPFDNSTTPVGFFSGEIYDSLQTLNNASPYGVYDLVDNVREWCFDWYQRDYYAESTYKNPTGPPSGTQKVVRGGGYLFYPDNMRTTFRTSYEPTTTTNYIGFRCVIRRKNDK
jgi:formylglycine-generating enzyme required for sulfatase activity